MSQRKPLGSLHPSLPIISIPNLLQQHEVSLGSGASVHFLLIIWWGKETSEGVIPRLEILFEWILRGQGALDLILLHLNLLDLSFWISNFWISAFWISAFWISALDPRFLCVTLMDLRSLSLGLLNRSLCCLGFLEVY